MLRGDSVGKHRTIVEYILIVHFIAKTDTDSRVCLASVVATARFWAELHIAGNDLVRPHIVYKGYRFQREHTILCFTIRRV